MWRRTAGRNPGRDGCRVPLPWSGSEPPFGFSGPGTDEADPWLPTQPASWRDCSVEAQTGDPDSMLELYRRALTLRRSVSGFGSEREPLRWTDTADGVLAFRRGDEAACVVNLSADPVALPPHDAVLLTSSPLTADGQLPSDCAVWLKVE
jgi:alpha-glucosidase